MGLVEQHADGCMNESLIVPLIDQHDHAVISDALLRQNTQRVTDIYDNLMSVMQVLLGNFHRFRVVPVYLNYLNIKVKPVDEVNVLQLMQARSARVAEQDSKHAEDLDIPVGKMRGAFLGACRKLLDEEVTILNNMCSAALNPRGKFCVEFKRWSLSFASLCISCAFC